MFILLAYTIDFYILYNLISFYDFINLIILKLLIVLIFKFLFQGIKNQISGILTVVIAPLTAKIFKDSYQLFRFGNGFITYAAFYFLFFGLFREAFPVIGDSFILKTIISLIAASAYEEAFYRNQRNIYNLS